MTKAGDVYCTYVRARAKPAVEPPNHGKPIAVAYTKRVEKLFLEGVLLEKIAEDVGRTISSVLCQLINLHYLSVDAKYNYVYTPKLFKINQPQPTKEIIMAANIETKVLIAGQDASTMSDKEIFSFIAKLEKEQATLESVKNKPKKLNAALNALQEDITKLIAYVDERP